MRGRPSSPAGFTLVELMVGSTLAAFLTAGVFSTFIYLGVNLTRLANYRALEAKSREALGYLAQDLELAQGVKSGTSPTSGSLTLVLPSGQVTYTYTASTGVLQRQANFGANQSFNLLSSDACSCTAFSFNYYTTSGGSPVSQITTGFNVPYSIKLIQVQFTVQTPPSSYAGTQQTYTAVSSPCLLRNRQFADGS